MDAISRARHDISTGEGGGYRHANCAGVAPVQTLAEKIEESASLRESFRRRVFARTEAGIGLPCPKDLAAGLSELHVSDVSAALTALFEPTDRIFIGTRYACSPRDIKPASEWARIFRNAETKLSHATLGTRSHNAMADFCEYHPHICPNPLSGDSAPTKAGDKRTYRGDQCVSAFRYFVVESDSLAADQQLDLIFGLERFGFPLAAVIYSGGKSFHAWYRCVGINTLPEWEAQVKKRLFPLLAILGADKACSNAARLSRTPGMFRGDKGRIQKIIYLANTEKEKFIMTTDSINNLENIANELINNGTQNPAAVVEAEVVSAVAAAPAAPAAVAPAAPAATVVHAVACPNAAAPQTLAVQARMNGNPEDMAAWAQFFYETCCSHDGQPRLIFWRQAWYAYEVHAGMSRNAAGTALGPLWHEISEDDLAAKLVAFLNAARFYQRTRKSVSPAVIKSILCNLNSVALCNLPSTCEMPCFLHEQKKATGWLITQNAAINVEALVACAADPENATPERQAQIVKPLTPDLFCSYSVPYEFNPQATCPRFEKYLEEVMPDPDARAQLQMMAGLLLVPDTSYNVAFFLYGEGGTGKSVFAEVMLTMLGKENCCSVPLTQISKRFRSIDLTTHLANICNDLSMGAGSQMHDITSIFKAVTSGENIPTERKFKDPRTAKAIARLVFTTNQLPKFQDRSHGVWDRMRIFHFTQRFRETPEVSGEERTVTDGIVRRQNPNLVNELKQEMPGILVWAIRGLVELRKHRSFPETAEGIRLKDELRMRSTPERDFLASFLVADPEGRVPTRDLYLAYVDWCKQNGERILLQNQLWDAIEMLFPKCQKRRGWENGSQITFCVGVSRISDEAEVEEAVEVVQPVFTAAAEQPAALPAVVENPTWLADMFTAKREVSPPARA